MELYLNFLPVLEGKADIVGAVDGGKVHHAAPAFKGELCQCIWQGLEALKEGVNVGSLGLYPIQLSYNLFKALLGGFKALGQAVVAFLVFGLVKGDWAFSQIICCTISEISYVSSSSVACSASSSVVLKSRSIISRQLAMISSLSTSSFFAADRNSSTK